MQVVHNPMFKNHLLVLCVQIIVSCYFSDAHGRSSSESAKVVLFNLEFASLFIFGVRHAVTL